MEKLEGARRVYLPPQVAHVYVQQVREYFRLHLPHSLGERGATHDSTGVTHENFEDRVLLWCQADPHSASRHAVAQRVEREIGDPEDGRPRQVRASQEGMDARQE